MAYNVKVLNRLVDQFERLPGVGRKGAQRIAFHLLSQPKEQIDALASAITEAAEKIKHCAVCVSLSDSDICPICSDSERDRSTVCVVSDPRDILSFERTREYKGLYHVLHGVISPMDGIGPDQLYIKELLTRLGTDTDIKEVIMATSPTVEGEATAMYLARLIKPFGINVSRLAYGVPVGASLEYADDVTLMRALEGRSVL